MSASFVLLARPLEDMLPPSPYLLVQPAGGAVNGLVPMSTPVCYLVQPGPVGGSAIGSVSSTTAAPKKRRSHAAERNDRALPLGETAPAVVPSGRRRRSAIRPRPAPAHRAPLPVLPPPMRAATPPFFVPVRPTAPAASAFPALPLPCQGTECALGVAPPVPVLPSLSSTVERTPPAIDFAPPPTVLPSPSSTVEWTAPMETISSPVFESLWDFSEMELSGWELPDLSPVDPPAAVSPLEERVEDSSVEALVGDLPMEEPAADPPVDGPAVGEAVREVLYDDVGDICCSPWCVDTPVLAGMLWRRIFLPHYRVTEAAPSAVASVRFLWILFKMWVIGTLNICEFCDELKQLILRRWVLASRPGPVCQEDYLLIDRCLGWEAKVTHTRLELSFAEKLSRFIDRGNKWIADITAAEGLPLDILKDRLRS